MAPKPTVIESMLQHLVQAIGLASIVLAILIAAPLQSDALPSDGEELFTNHCSGCHVNGGNIIRRGKTLKLAALQRNGLDDPIAIARIAREGIGQMSAYGDVLGIDGDRLVAEWIWDQAQNAWIHG